MKRVFASRVVLILSGTGLLLLPRLAIADTGIPMLALAWPVAWCLLPAVILSEAYFARRELGLAWGASVRLSAIANLISTFAGIPLILALVVVVGSTADALNLQSHVWRVLLFPFESLRTKPTGLNPFWPMYLSCAVLCVPFCAISIWLETRVGMRRLGTERAPAIRRWSFRANAASYAVIISALLVLASLDAARTR